MAPPEHTSINRPTTRLSTAGILGTTFWCCHYVFEGEPSVCHNRSPSLCYWWNEETRYAMKILEWWDQRLNKTLITSCTQTLYAVRVLRARGMCEDALQTVYLAVVLTRLKSMPHQVVGVYCSQTSPKRWWKLLFVAALVLASVILWSRILKLCTIWQINKCF